MATHADWLTLVQLDGLVVSEPVLEEKFPGGPLPVGRGLHNWFRRQAERYLVSRSLAADKRAAGARQWVDFLLQTMLEIRSWKKGHELPDSLRVVLSEFEQELRPDRALVQGDKPVFLVSIVDPDQSLDRRDRQPGRWKASPTTKLDRLLRETGTPLGLVTNGEDHRLLFAPAGMNTGSITWTSRMLAEEKATLDAFCSLLGRDVLSPEEEQAQTLADLCRMSQDRQADVADQLGEQVRNGLERLLWAWDAADRDAQGDLLKNTTETELYEMGLVVMMRLVFLLYAEERDLLPHGEVLYDQGYGLTYLWHALLKQKRTDETRMRETYDAWDRFLATGRLVHRGCGHPDLSLIAYGGRLFDPARFPVLEDARCKVSNRTFYDVLQLLLFARQRKGGEPQRVGYWAIDVEQIGYIYEGLLDHRCARAGDDPVVKLRGAGEAAMPLPELEKLDREALIQLVVKASGRKEDALREALQREPDPKDVEQLKAFPSAVVERVLPFAAVVQCAEVVPSGWRYLTTGTSRRASGAHYTPQSLTERIVRVTLEPLVYRNVEGKPGLLVEPRQVKTARELLDLKVCDIAMGSGAFLVQAVRYLGQRVVEAWDRAIADAHGVVLSMPYAEPMDDATSERAIDPEKRDEMVVWARRYVVERSIYGVDVNPLAVEMAKLSLWLTTLAKDRPFTFLDHSLRCGDSLVGVDLQQLMSWSLDGKGEEQEVLQYIVKKAVDEAVQLRNELQSIAVVEAADLKRKAALLERANAAMDRVRLAGDLLIAPSFAEENGKKRQQLRNECLGSFVTDNDGAAWSELAATAKQLLDGQRTFHWPFEFPEAFLGRDRGGFDSIVGNPPFVRGRDVARLVRQALPRYLLEVRPHSHGNSDLAAHFFVSAVRALASPSTCGLVATNTIGQGDTRATGLEWIINNGFRIYHATASTPWSGQANVFVSIVHLCSQLPNVPVELDGRKVAAISSSLDSLISHGLPHSLQERPCRAFKGSNVYGKGFILTHEHATSLLQADSRNSEVVFPYINGKNLNTEPDLIPPRWVINFANRSLEDASSYPQPFGVVRDFVLPERRQNPRKSRREKWWCFGDFAKGLHHAIKPLRRVMACAQTSKYLTFVHLPTGYVFDQKVIVFASDDDGLLSLLQSNIHRAWVDSRGGTLKGDYSYTIEDCYLTFPMPVGWAAEPAAIGPLASVEREYTASRREVMLTNNEGLTKTYNRFHAPKCEEPDIERLRKLHVEMDNAVRDAYGWSDLDLEHGWVKTITTEEKKDKKTGKLKTIEKVEWRYTISEAAKQEVLRRLLKLNHEIYEREVAEGLHDKKKAAKAAVEDGDPPPKKGCKPKKKSPGKNQGSLF